MLKQLSKIEKRGAYIKRLSLCVCVVVDDKETRRRKEVALTEDPARKSWRHGSLCTEVLACRDFLPTKNLSNTYFLIPQAYRCFNN